MWHTDRQTHRQTLGVLKSLDRRISGLKIILIGKHFIGNVEALHQSILWISVLYTLSEINGKAAVLAWNISRKVCVKEKQRMYTCSHFFMDKQTGWLMYWVLQKSSSHWSPDQTNLWPILSACPCIFYVSRFIVTLIYIYPDTKKDLK